MPRKGENIYKRKDGRWEGRFIRQKISGIAKYSYVYGKSYSEVKKKLELKKTQCYQRTNVQSFIGQDILFKDICILWLEDIKSTLKESSYIRYSNIISTYIILLLGDIAINDIDYALLSSYVSELLSSGGTKGEGLSSKTVADILSVIKAILKYASSPSRSKSVAMMTLSDFLARFLSERMSSFSAGSLMTGAQVR